MAVTCGLAASSVQYNSNCSIAAGHGSRHAPAFVCCIYDQLYPYSVLMCCGGV